MKRRFQCIQWEISGHGRYHMPTRLPGRAVSGANDQAHDPAGERLDYKRRVGKTAPPELFPV
jgi:hypothetical protein